MTKTRTNYREAIMQTKIKAGDESPKMILAAESTTRTDAKITGTAYSGGTFGQTWSGIPIVVDLGRRSNRRANPADVQPLL